MMLMAEDNSQRMSAYGAYRPPTRDLVVYPLTIMCDRGYAMAHVDLRREVLLRAIAVVGIAELKAGCHR